MKGYTVREACVCNTLLARDERGTVMLDFRPDSCEF